MKILTIEQAKKVAELFEEEMQSNYAYKCGAFKELFIELLYQHPGIINRIEKHLTAVTPGPPTKMTGNDSQ